MLLRARVVLQDGQLATPCIPNEELGMSWSLAIASCWMPRPGRFWPPIPRCREVGELARLVRRIDSTRVEVKLRDFEQRVVQVTAALAREIDREQGGAGSQFAGVLATEPRVRGGARQRRARQPIAFWFAIRLPKCPRRP